MPRRNRVSFVAVALAAGCAVEPAEEIGGRAAALTPVTWTEVVGASAAGNDLTKTAPETAFNAGAVSVQTLAGDGYVEFTTGEATADKVVGLSSGNGGQGLADIDFGIRLNASGRASIYEGGVNRGGIGTYAAGQTFRVKAEDGVVTYYRNGVLRYTSAVAPTFPLLVDTSLRTPGATVQDVVIEPIDFWTAAVGVAVDGNDITKTAPEDAFNAGAVSLASIPSGDGFMEFRVADVTSLKVAGLGTGNSNTSRNDIEFAISLNANGAIQVYESGTLRGTFGTYDADDVFRVQVEGGVVSYLQNRVPFYTSALAPTYPLLLDTSIRTPGASILAARLVAGYVADECAPLEDTIAADGFYSIAADGDVMVVGQRLAEPPVATVYRRTQDGWTFEQTLDMPVGADGFAGRVATDGQTIAVRVGDLQGGIGSVQVYGFDGDSWVEEALLEPCPGDQFGLNAIAVRGDLLVAGVSFEESAFVFRRTGGGSWLLDGIVGNLDPEINDMFGFPVAVGGDRIFVGAYNRADVGAIYVFRHNPALPDPPEPPSCSNVHPGKWRQKSEILAPPAGPAEDHHFASGELDANPAGTRFLVGDPRIDVHVFQVSGGVWSEIARLEPWPVEFVGRHAAFGGPGGDSVVATSSNDTYVYAELADGWAQIAHSTAAGPLAVSDDTVVQGLTTSVDVYSLDSMCLQE